MSTADRGDDLYYTHPITQEKLPSFSKIMKMLSKDFLMYWSANMVARAQVYDTDMVYREQARILNETWVADKELDPQDAMYHALRNIPWKYRDEKAELGTAVHAAIERYNSDDLPGIYPAEIAPYMRQFEGFLQDHKPHIIANEVTVYNRTIGYAGTLDILAGLPIPEALDVPTRERLAIIDIKTGKSVYPEAGIQQNAYANGEVWYDEWQQQDVTMPEIECAYVLHIRPTFYKLIPVVLSQQNFDVFCSLREVFDWDQNSKKGILGSAKQVKVK